MQVQHHFSLQTSPKLQASFQGLPAPISPTKLGTYSFGDTSIAAPFGKTDLSGKTSDFFHFHQWISPSEVLQASFPYFHPIASERNHVIYQRAASSMTQKPNPASLVVPLHLHST